MLRVYRVAARVCCGCDLFASWYMAQTGVDAQAWEAHASLMKDRRAFFKDKKPTRFHILMATICLPPARALPPALVKDLQNMRNNFAQMARDLMVYDKMPTHPEPA